jgi:hypothetical protein
MTAKDFSRLSLKTIARYQKEEAELYGPYPEAKFIEDMRYDMMADRY